MQTSNTTNDIDTIITTMKRLSTIPNDKLLDNLPYNFANQIEMIIVNEVEHDELDEVICKLNQIADKISNGKILLPIIQNFSLIKNQQMRPLTSVEITVFHYQLLEPFNTIINPNDLINAIYCVPRTNNCLLRAFFYWSGCYFLRLNLMKKAEFMFRQCCEVPIMKKTASNFGIEAAKKLILLTAAHFEQYIIPFPYSLFIPKSYKEIAAFCSKYELKSILQSSFDKIFEKDGNNGIVEYLYQQCQIKVIERIAKAYSTILIDDIIMKIKIERNELIKCIEHQNKLGKDWVIIGDTILFGNNHLINPLQNEFSLLQMTEITLQQANDFMNLKKKTKKVNLK
ncbi:hypothetical protein EHI8A_212680 [Entamoeba histolytica HM-1:IMSS-B]|uniref:COP9 signalosome complex subunit 3 n=6 Tax=Entamoeba histolytica TaxID=5759 RepID=C4M7D3_ENTH1|nr:hypothetical protein EHI_011200 [Entamoeba histolytica HM-1:IMSS]EMD42970.1 Hypothetical protein EHI5A_134570 [Entamoeba histolytica KU27]EMH72984.1 hypothetical protein EHI8A_212680 [Entamoeba histolytica HM-1:IMSS-B]EMS14739.1 hypothetical protein KM1_174670 [Entamoeba histolytica HM-3:IMSS]ENY65413.1 hypothetical protein EHI7A_183170 [Entamoeba histolytica HM-1:IMSS-A]GAT97437.1 hypothetical protein CL6EHI_011200 [Entamoeba histolytica]|eukprot:XP_651868.1 hypothetical protein EHI_011200 [Entamoeba histolytica HM-1:IMSS]